MKRVLYTLVAGLALAGCASASGCCIAFLNASSEPKANLACLENNLTNSVVILALPFALSCNSSKDLTKTFKSKAIIAPIINGENNLNINSNTFITQ